MTAARTGSPGAGTAGTARAEIFRRIGVALAGAPPPEPVPRDYRRTGELDPDAVLEQLVDRLVDYKAAVHRTDPAGIPAAIARVLADVGSLVVPPDLPDEWLSGYPGAVHRDDPPLDLSTLDGVDAVLTGCAVAIAETGTIVLDAGTAQGRRALTLVPDHHLCVVRADQVVGIVPESIPRLDGRRPLTFISGPSATSDIELRRVEGVHGPRRLDVLLVTP